MLGDALRAAAPDGGGDPSIALLSDGPDNSAWFEHQEIARRLGLPIVAPDDLFVRRGRLHARLDDAGARELQVVYRRTDEDRLRDGDGGATWLAGALLGPCRSGTLTVVNPLGAGLADDKLVHAYVDEMVRFYLRRGAAGALGARPTTSAIPRSSIEAMPRLGEMVVKPRNGPWRRGRGRVPARQRRGSRGGREAGGGEARRLDRPGDRDALDPPDRA